MLALKATIGTPWRLAHPHSDWLAFALGYGVPEAAADVAMSAAEAVSKGQQCRGGGECEGGD